MRMSRSTVLSDVELKQIDAASMRILSEVGLQINSDPVLDLLANVGVSVDRAERRARFSEICSA